MRFYISSTIDSEKYNYFLLKSPEANFYHLKEWHEVLKKTYGISPYYVIAEDKNDIVGCIPLAEVKGFLKGKRLISLPLSHCVPILSQDEEITLKLLKLLQNLTNKYKYIELRCNNEINVNNSTKRSEYIESKIILSDYGNIENYWIKLPQRARRDVRKALLNIQVKKEKNLLDFKNLYHFTSISKKRQGALAYPEKFFQYLFENLLPYTQLFTAYYESKPVASILIFNFKKLFLYAYSGSTYDENIVKHYPIDLLFWEVIQEAFKEGQEVFDLGSSPRQHNSLIQFKNKWNPTHYDLNYHCIANNYIPIAREGKISTCANSLFKILPLPINKLISPYILKEAF